MKKFLIIAFVIFAKSASAQKDTVGLNVPFFNNTVVYERVIDVPNAPANVLYSNAGLWFAETHPYVEQTQLQFQDPDLLRVVGRVTSATDMTNKVLWQKFQYTVTENFTLQIDCKDNKYRIRIYNIVDVFGSDRLPVDDMMFALINSKSYNVGASASVLKTADLQQRFRALNIIVNNVINDLTKSMLADNSF